MTTEMSSFAHTIMDQKYAHTMRDGTKENWAEIAHRTATSVMHAVDAPRGLVAKVERAIVERKLMPGGRYLYASGRPLHQIQNCVLNRVEDSREGWAEHLSKACMALMTGAGLGVVYSNLRPEGTLVRKSGGFASGPLPLMQATNEVGRGIRQGGDRRAAIWAGLHWNHADIIKFIHMKDWSPEVQALKAKDYNFAAPMDMTNISVILDDAFFAAYQDTKHRQHAHARLVYYETVAQMLRTAEPGFSIDCGVNQGENLRNAPVCGGTAVLTSTGYRKVIDIVGRPITVWTGKQWAHGVVFKQTSPGTQVVRVTFTGGRYIRCDPTHPFLVERYEEHEVARHELVAIDLVKAEVLQIGDILHDSPPETSQVDGIYEFEYKVLSIQPDGIEAVYCCDVGVPEHSFDAEGVIIGNCTEVSSRDDSDICNLASLNLARIDSVEEMEDLVRTATAFLVAGTVYSDVPYPKIDQVRTKNRRLGLGLMGIHEWLLKKGKTYGPDEELEEYLKVYARSGEFAEECATELGLSVPVKTWAIAPTGTIGIVAETTTGIEPIFCVAYKRRYMKGEMVNYQYVVDPCAKRLIESGVMPEAIEDAYSIDVERRVSFQAWVQQYVDHGISSTINIPAWGSETNNEGTVADFAEMLIRYLPKLRGVTCYPDGARSGQPISPVRYATAIKHIGEVFVEQADVCELSKGATCG